MARYFIAVVQDILAVSLVLAALFALLGNSNKKQKILVLSSGSIIAFISAIVSSVFRSLPNFVNRTNLSFYSMIPIVIIFITYLFINTDKVKNKNQVFYERACLFLVATYYVATVFYYLPPIFLYPREFVPYGESGLSTAVLLKIIGYVSGILFVGIAAVTVYQVAKRLNYITVRFFTKIALFVLGLTQIIVILQRLYVWRIIPRNDWLFALIAFVINQGKYFVFAVMAVLLAVPIIVFVKNRFVLQEYANPALKRKALAQARSARRWSLAVFTFFFLSSMTLSVLKYFSEKEVPLSEPEPYELEKTTAKVLLSLLEDDKLHRFEYLSNDGYHVRFIAIKKNVGSYALCYDACEICGASGYFMRGDEVVCKLCDVVMNKGTIGFAGGCNPIPLPFSVTDGYLCVDVNDLEIQSKLFR